MNYSSNYYIERNRRAVRDWYVDDDECYVPPKSEIEQSQDRARRLQRVMNTYKCSMADAYTFIDFRDEGYNAFQAAVMAGIQDPHE